MKKVFAILATIILTVLLTIPANATSAWYQVSFTGADIWTYSADNNLEARTDQSAPRRYATYLTGPRVLVATTYGVGGLVPTTFNTWAPTSGFAFDQINLWGAGTAGAWGEKYVSVGTPDPDHGFSSWKVIQSPTGWTSGIVVGGDPWSADETHAFPVWRSGTGSTLGLGNMNDPDFKFTFQVLIDNPATAFETDGKLRLFFGGFKDNFNQTGPDNYEVSGSMTLTATPIPGTVLLLGSGLVGLGFLGRRKIKRS